MTIGFHEGYLQGGPDGLEGYLQGGPDGLPDIDATVALVKKAEKVLEATVQK